MAEELKELIEKIQQEGVKAAEDKAKQIQDQAQFRAQDIVAKAEQQAKDVIAEAKDKITQMQESADTSLKQAGRDLLLSLRKEIKAMLDKLIITRVREALSPAELLKIITVLIQDYSKGKKGDIIISLKKEDLEKLEKGFLSELKDEIKKDIILNPSDDIRGGFIISYDSGKSHYDFTDKALAEYLGSHLNPRLEDILKQAAPGKNKA